MTLLRLLASTALALSVAPAFCYGARRSLPAAQAPLDLDFGSGSGNADYEHDGNGGLGLSSPPNLAGLPPLVAAVDAMQEQYFDSWLGTWPAAIDWTAAVLGTHVPAALKTISHVSQRRTRAREGGSANDDVPPELRQSREDLVADYFSDLVGFYWGQAWLELLFQAYDDILWVVLGWLEAVTFVQGHARLRRGGGDGGKTADRAWYGEKFIRPFAHRARIFWEAAENGWDETLCGGGMVWNPRLAPYKNAITNELFIAASAAMYIHFPGDDIGAPLVGAEDEELDSQRSDRKPEYKAHDKKYLRAAVKAYDWLYASNMTNERGLFVDGFHISGWRGGRNPSLGTKKCDIRDETVYTYNQGVVLTGQRNLWQATGNITYLKHGHSLIQSVINATGWSDSAAERQQTGSSWQGLGRLGVLEDRCDSSGDCSQDAQMFKGIFFLHFDAFCQPLPVSRDDHVFGHKASAALADLHAAECAQYHPWVAHNARAAAQTRDGRGLFSMWWTEKLAGSSSAAERGAATASETDEPEKSAGGADVRNRGVPDDEIWRINPGSGSDDDGGVERGRPSAPSGPSYDGRHSRRTVEIQSGGVSVLRALIESDIRANAFAER